jgi:hypothetical protein
MQKGQYIRGATVVSVVAIFLLAGFSYAATSFLGQGTVDFDSIRIGREGVGGVTFFNGSIINQTTNNGIDNPITFADNVRIDGRVWRGGTQGPGDGSPFIMDDDAQVKGDLRVDGTLEAGSIVGLSGVVASAISKDGGLQGLQDAIDAVESKNKTQDTRLSSVESKNGSQDSRLTSIENKNKSQDNSISGLSDDFDNLDGDVSVLLSNQSGIYEYLRCTLNLGQFGTYPTISDMLFCWDLYMGTSLEPSSAQVMPLSPQSILVPEDGKNQVAPQGAKNLQDAKDWEIQRAEDLK